MTDIAIQVEGLGKKYRIGGIQERHTTLRDRLAASAKMPLNFVRGKSRKPQEEIIWSLRNISLSVNRGEVVGVIGRNGAGKSTLLKILSRITEPTEGFADIHGRVGSLLEVGTGFHPELTGRENIFLNGAVLGMRRSEIERKFDEMVAFAEVEKFIDTPVKHYSSGMYLRLAFAVAAHLEPEVLLVDEVLAVGDAVFQKKCLGRMGEVAKEGRTVLFVSHNMEAILNLCPRSFVLDKGNLAFAGTSEEAVRLYLNALSSRGAKARTHELYRKDDGHDSSGYNITCIEVLDSAGNPKPSISTWDDITIRIHYHSNENIQHGTFILDVLDYKQQRLLVMDSGQSLPIRRGSNFVDCFIPQFPLSAGEYFLGAGLALSNNQWLWREPGIASFRIHGQDVFEIGRPPIASRMIFAARHEWQSPAVSA